MLDIVEHDRIILRGGRVIDPFTGQNGIEDVVIENGLVVDELLSDDSDIHNAYILDASGLIVCPGLMDIHVHLREPGQTEKETIATGTAAAAAGGFTYVACMPNTVPAIDNADVVRFIVEQAHRANHTVVGPIAAITRGRDGKEVCDFESLMEAGAVAFSDDGTGVEDDTVMRTAFERARALGALLIQHCEYRALSAGGVMHLGEVSLQLGLPGLDPRSEEAMIERDLNLCRETAARYHVAHISTERAVELVRRAKSEGLPVTCEVTPHHLVLTDEACVDGDPNCKMHPPLRGWDDVEACRDGLLDGTIDCIATDHAPHTLDEKARGFLEAPPGIVGLETAVALVAQSMIYSGLAEWTDVIGWFTAGPARVLQIDTPGLREGAAARISLIDPDFEWEVDPTAFESKGRNTPFSGWKLSSKPVGVIQGRRLIHGSIRADKPFG